MNSWYCLSEVQGGAALPEEVYQWDRLGEFITLSQFLFTLCFLYVNGHVISKHLESATMTATCCHTPLIRWTLIPPELLFKLNSFLCYFLFYHFKIYFTYQFPLPPLLLFPPLTFLLSLPPPTLLPLFRLGKAFHGNRQTMACQVEETLS